MPRDENEPQSYGSGPEWVEGDVGQTVNRQKGNPNSQHSDFYESRRDSEESGEHQGGHVSDYQASDYQASEGVRPSPPVGQEDAAQTGQPKRDSFFKKRDYQ
ncbi:MAG TPA: hypothetical protein VJ276_20970 [Thermoanaerobaculia bacterium]|nr:hypothetical protein [Thermoanaerobaculia bacterium]